MPNVLAADPLPVGTAVPVEDPASLPSRPMRLVFYHELRAEEGISLRGILAGDAPASGGMARIGIASYLARLGARVEILHHLDGEQTETLHGVLCHRMQDVGEAVAFCNTLDASDILIVNQYIHLPALCRALLPGCRAKKVVWAGCSIPFEWLDAVGAGYFDRVVNVSRQATEIYRLHRRFDVTECIFSSAPDMMAGQTETVDVARPNTVAFLGALRGEKGFHHVLRAWPLVRAACPEATLAVLGSVRLHLPDSPVGATGVLTPEMEKEYLQPILPPSGKWEDIGISFLYPQPKQRVYEILGQTWVGVVNPNCTGAIETYCRAAVETQMCGCPCIGGGAGGLLDTIADSRSGFHLRTQEPAELAGRIVEVLRDKALRERLSAGARQHSAYFVSPDREARDWMELAARIDRGAPPPHPRRWGLDIARWLGAGRAKIILRSLLGWSLPFA